MATNGVGGRAIATVSIKIPPFWHSDPDVWFAQVEAQITTWGIILQRTKFDHIVASLLPEYATEIQNIIFKPPADTPYDTLKEELEKITTASQQTKLQQLFSSDEMGEEEVFPTSA